MFITTYKNLAVCQHDLFTMACSKSVSKLLQA